MLSLIVLLTEEVIKSEMRSIGNGKMTVLLFSADMLFRVCRYRSCDEEKFILQEGNLTLGPPVALLDYH